MISAAASRHCPGLRTDCAPRSTFYAAARTSPKLRLALRPVAQAHRDNVERLARRYFTPADDSAFGALLRLVLNAMMGMVVTYAQSGPYAELREDLDTLHELAARILNPARKRRS